jgi:hypothetical protein
VNLMARQQGNAALPDINSLIAAPDSKGPFDHIADLIFPAVAVQGRSPVRRHDFLDHGSVQERSGRISSDDYGLAEDIKRFVTSILRRSRARLCHLALLVTGASPNSMRLTGRGENQFRRFIQPVPARSNRF